jgi:hypothetical protein
MPKQADLSLFIIIRCSFMNTNLNSRGRVYVSSTAVRNAGFRPGQKLAVARTGNKSVELRPFNQVKRDSRIASYTVEPTGAVRMSASKIGGTRSGQVTASRRRVNIQF